MGSSGSKEASSGARRVRSIGTRVFRPSCFRRPQVSLDDGCREETGRTKDGHLDKIRKSHQDPNDSRCFSLPDNSVQQEHDVQEHSSTVLLDSYSISDNQASARCASLHLNSCFGLSHDNTKFEPGETVSLNSQDDAHLVAHAFDSTSENMEEHHAKDISSTEDAAASNADFDGDECPQENHAIASGIERKLSQRRQEPLEDTARFSRTRSVGRLRERVLRRTSFPEGRFGFLLSEESSAYSRQDSRRRLLDALANIPYSDGGDNDRQLVSSTCQASNNCNATNSHIHLTETSELRETSSHGTVDHSSTFLERRRRIRSQVRALQRLGSRYENISGHDRPCILSGQHRSDNCACVTSNHSRNPANQTSSRASISRIVMLAEALFEVLDEIHQQAVVLASRPSSASLASVPAPKEVVDRMPVKNYTESQKCRGNEAAQCYICLVEYEEGDSMRILPCLHEFHQSCVDKWLKEIHRVCPLCRYDVCLSDASHVNGLD